MSPSSENRVDSLSVACPYCGAHSGKPCKRVRGYDPPIGEPWHHHRFQKAAKAAREAAAAETKENA